MKDFLISVLTAIIGTIGFSLLFSVDLKYLPFAALGGAISWAVYLWTFGIYESVFFGSLAAAFVSTIYSEICAKYNRTPATVFLLPCLIPLVPGSSLYYSMSNLIAENYDASAKFGMETASVVLGLSGGVVAASLIVYALRNLIKTRKENQSKKTHYCG